ncbi:LRR receptor-like serine/threonine-protein kinase FLS2 [Cinnamomum micranthum f. kanehirae]|uniref:LRR receptor-like serine/threonine-protein kinase FLS2 n=1 Tax=Cinnamomum micranthum f. kanehirae TaxID=337451 RepID=A0A3S3NA51_9MAGN|nr:LRR receptor-like serine/threonine-protein kinase FLS2 [Cinnamomum micranthum f. kanehirae]
MEWPPAFYFWVVSFTFQLWVYGCFGCFYEEESALLELKSSINYPNGTSLPSWRVGTNCCTWKGVTCSSTVGRVIELDLSSTRGFLDNEYWSMDVFRSMNGWYLNPSLLLPFEELQSLDLSDNLLQGFIDEEALNRWSRLSKLEELDLSHNSLNKTILPFLGALKSLEKLDVSANFFRGPLPIKAFENLTSLRTIYFSWNRFNDSQSIQGFCKFKDLQRLDLSHNNFKGPIPLCFSNLTSLQLLNLSNNGFSGMIPTSTTGNDESKGPLPIKGFCKFKDIKWLDLSFNHFEGSIPSCLSNFSKLQLLDLSNNRFSGKIPASTFSNVTSLSYLSLAKNNFSGIVEFRSFAQLSKLKEFVLSDNNLEVEIEYPRLNFTFQLTALGLSNCKLSKYTGGGIPNFLYSQRELVFVDLSHNHLLGKFPNWLLENNPRLQYLMLMNNSFWGTFLLPLHFNHTSMILLDVSNNHIDGLLPSNIGYFLPILVVLNMSRNSFYGSLPPSFGNMSLLQTLDLSHNNLSGEIPVELAAAPLSVSTLKLSNNSFHGKISSTYLLNMTILNHLYLDNNHFVGTIPPSLFNVSWLWGLNIGDNHLSGRIPSQIGDNLRLSTLILRGNHFDGLVPFEICKLQYLKFLDLSDNSLSGPIPSCSNFTNLKFMHLENNSFSGFIPRALSSSSSMISLNIRHNHIADVIPVWIGRLSRLRILLLKGNNLHGHIPNELCQLKNLNLLDLSYNNLFGSLPSCLNNLTFGRSIFLDDFSVGGGSSSYFSSPLNVYTLGTIFDEVTEELKEVEFVTKRMENSYKGGILNYMSGIDVSCNQLTGEIPREMGQLSGLHSLNLSYNQFAGPIPATFKKLSQIESLDLSHNKLNGTIPSELTELYSLSVFSVAYNNLSGRTPDMKSQFSTFSESSYEGNPLLCGPPLSRNCISTAPIGEVPEKDDASIVSFYGSFVGSYLVFPIGTVGVLYFTS